MFEFGADAVAGAEFDGVDAAVAGGGAAGKLASCGVEQDAGGDDLGTERWGGKSGGSDGEDAGGAGLEGGVVGAGDDGGLVDGQGEGLIEIGENAVVGADVFGVDAAGVGGGCAGDGGGAVTVVSEG